MTIGELFGIKIHVRRGFVFSSILLLLIYTSLGIWSFELSMTTAIWGGVLVTTLHWLSDLAHQLGHAWVASRTGYPMSLLVFNWFLIGSAYPKGEPELPAEIHIRRALGGIPVTFLLGAVALVLFLMASAATPAARYVLLAVALLNLLVFGVGALLPLGFTDGSTLLTWLPRRHMSDQG